LEDTSIATVIKSLETLMQKESWDEAETLLIKNEFKFDSGVYHYNLGVVKIKKFELAQARYHFEQAKLKGFNAPEVEGSLKQVREDLRVDFIESDTTFSDVFYRSSLGVPGDLYVTFTVISLLIIVLNFKKIPNLFTKVMLLVSATIPALFLLIFIENKDVAVSISDLEVRSGPSRIFDQVHEIPKGAKIVLGKTYNGWRQVIYPERMEGWINTDRFKILRD
jgi:hypothetical protein